MPEVKGALPSSVGLPTQPSVQLDVPTPSAPSPLSREIGRVVRAFTPPVDPPRMHYGTIVSASGGTATITVSGGTAEVAGVRYLADVTPSAGNVCVLLSQGGDMLIIGTLT